MIARLLIILEMIKFSHTVFAMPFALLGACLASELAGGWRWLDLVGLVLCMVFARSAAMAFNRWADRDIDAQNPRTSRRAIPVGQLSAQQVLAFAAACSIAFIASTSLFLLSRGNPWPLLLSVPVLAFLLGYSYTKRFTVLSHVWLGTALALSPPAAWLAIRGEIDWPPVWLGLAVVCWVSGFDILYACQDIDADRRIGLHSIPAWLGLERAFWVSRAAHACMLAALVGFGMATPMLGYGFGFGLVCVGVMLVAEHWLVRRRDLAHINAAFLHVNGVISVCLLLATLADLYLL